MQTQTPEGYIGNYIPEARLTNWDIWAGNIRHLPWWHTIA